MWTEAAKWLSKFPEAIVTATDGDGYPVSVRVSTNGYQAATGELAVSLPEVVDCRQGPANLLCHVHDEKLWKLQMITVKGTLEKRDGAWVFRSENFLPPSRLAVLDFIRNARRSAQRYLDKRGLPRPEVNWTAIKDIQSRAKS